MNKPVILCVDDEKLVLDSLKMQLSQFSISEGYIVEIAESGEEALELFAELIEDGADVPIIISDYIMPEMKGDELLKQIHTRAPQTMKILLTGQASIEGVTNAINHANLYRYIAKPWEWEDLKLTIKEAYSSYYKDRQLEEQNKQLLKINQELEQLSHSFVEAAVTALDSRDTTAAGHSKRLAKYVVRLAEAVNRVGYGKYRELTFSENQIREMHYAALLHDIGKIGVRESILLKRQRLSEERQYAVKYKLNYLKKYLECKKNKTGLTACGSRTLDSLDEWLQFIIEINERTFITAEEEQKIRDIAAITFIDVDGKSAGLLDEFEVENLTVKKGNLTRAEYDIIKTHAEYTYEILRNISWPEAITNVAEMAASHHEKINGTGYPKGLAGDEVSVQVRILAMLDIYEALTARDRSYKPAMSVEKALQILEDEANCGNLDRDILEIFVKERIFDLGVND